MPSQAQLVLPLLELAITGGGKVSSKEAYHELAKAHRLPESVTSRSEVLDCGQRHNLWERHVRFAKERAKAAGYMRSQSPGLWELTEDGRAAVSKSESAVVVTIVTDPAGGPIGAQIEINVGLPTVHTLHLGDARNLSWIGSGQIPLIVTSVPYFDLKEYEHTEGQMADIRSYDGFVAALGEAMRECFRVLTPGGRMAINVGDVLRSRGKHGTHEVLPLSADLSVDCRRIGFNALTGIIWHKLSNCRYEEGGAGVLGQPGMPRMCIKSETEQVLIFKKPGPNFHASPEQREASRIAKADWQKWVRAIWADIPGARGTFDHPAPYPVEVPYRLIRMMSYTGPEPHTVLDPFGGTFRTTVAAMRARRSSVGVEIAKGYLERGISTLRGEAARIRDAWLQPGGPARSKATI
jgi:DNA modification methylase